MNRRFPGIAVAVCAVLVAGGAEAAGRHPPDSADLIRTTGVSAPTTGTAGSGQADWKGIRPGRTTRTQVEAILGKPASERHGEDGALQYVYPPGAHLGFNRICFGRTDVVSQVGIGLFDEKDRVHFSELKRRYGLPRQLSAHSLRDPHSDQGTYVFPREAGLWVVADEGADEVHGATYYDPAREPDIPLPADIHHK